MTTSVEAGRGRASRWRSAGIRGCRCPGVDTRGLGARACPRARPSRSTTGGLPTGERSPVRGERGRSAIARSTRTSRSPTTRASSSPAAAARSPSSGRAATATRRSSRPALDVVCLEPMMAPVAALSTGEDLELAPRASGPPAFRLRVEMQLPDGGGPVVRVDALETFVELLTRLQRPTAPRTPSTPRCARPSAGSPGWTAP